MVKNLLNELIFNQQITEDMNYRQSKGDVSEQLWLSMTAPVFLLHLVLVPLLLQGSSVNFILGL